MVDAFALGRDANFVGVEAAGPALVAEGRIGDDEVKGPESVAMEELGISEGVAGADGGGWPVVQNHVHAGQRGGGGVLFLSVIGDLRIGLAGDCPRRRCNWFRRFGVAQSRS